MNRPHRLRLRSTRVIALFFLLASCAPTGQAQQLPPAAPEREPAPATAPPVEQVDEVVERDSPRASVADFFALCRANQHELAAGYLELPRAQQARGPVLAARLKAVLNRESWVDVEKLSPLSTGNLDDELPRLTDEIGNIEADDGTLEPVRIVKRNRDGGRWLFTLATVERIDVWYERLTDRWLIENLPAWLLRSGPKELLWWQWLALPLLGLVALAVGYLLSRVTGTVLGWLAARTKWRWDDDLVLRLVYPFALWWALTIIWFVLPYLSLYRPAEAFVHSGLRGAFLVGFFWMLSGMVTIGGQVLSHAPWAERNRASKSLIPLITRVGHMMLFALAAIALLSELGFAVTSLLAGLGVGGLAVALAAQKSLENLFGAFAIGADQPFREGDFVRIEDFVATVEYIGLRSTKFRTLDRTLITIPNGKLADMRLESFTARDRLRLFTIINLAPDATRAQVQAVASGFEAVLRAQEKLWTETVVTRLQQVSQRSVDIEVMAWFMTGDWNEFIGIREQVLLQFMGVVDEAGTRLSLPTQEVRVLAERNEPLAEAGRD